MFRTFDQMENLFAAVWPPVLDNSLIEFLVLQEVYILYYILQMDAKHGL